AVKTYVDNQVTTLGDTNFAENDLTLDANRTHNLDGNNLVFDGTGNIGIGNLPGAPQDKLDVDGQIRARGGFGASNGTFGLPSIGFYNDPDTGIFRDFANQIGISTGGAEAMRIDATQNVGIGVAIPQENLHVLGNIRTDGSFLSIDTNIGVPDYVFQKYFNGFSNLDKTYQFYSLSKIERFIRKNKHLPGITSAAKAKKDGYWNLSQSNLQNLEKIEELFLHTIEQEKKIEALKAENINLSKELETLKADMELIKAMLLKNQEND
ncbi:bZIP transcription factor, partial [Croceitalea sp. P007]